MLDCRGQRSAKRYAPKHVRGQQRASDGQRRRICCMQLRRSQGAGATSDGSSNEVRVYANPNTSLVILD